MSRLPGPLLLLFTIILCAGICEVTLRVFLPMPFYTIGSDYVPNAELYGWGYAPNARILVSDPDTGMVYEDIANSGGWRDLEHTFAKPAGTKRILILGDSNTFGANVSADKLYSRVLEKLYRQAGVNVEVITLAYGGWSTDQELEAYLREGRKYDPDAVVLQFTSNDLPENVLLPDSVHKRLTEKPFYYTLDFGLLTKHENPYFKSRLGQRERNTVKAVLQDFELFKRAYAALTVFRHSSQRRRLFGYPFDIRQLEQVKQAFGVREDEPLGLYLRSRIGQALDVGQVERLIDGTTHADDKRGILAVVSDVWLNQYWDSSQFHRANPDPNSHEWRILQALLQELRNQISSGTPLLLLSDQDRGLYEWETSWHRISRDEETERNFFAVNSLLASLVKGVELVPGAFVQERFHLDPHPNAAGHEAMAKNLFEYLRANHGDLMGAAKS